MLPTTTASHHLPHLHKQDSNQPIIIMFTRRKEILSLVDLIEAKEEKLQRQIDLIESRVCDNRVNAEANLEEVQSKHNRFVDKAKEGFEMIGNEIERLDSCLETHSKWDDETRQKFQALAEYLGVSIDQNNSPYTITQIEEA